MKQTDIRGFEDSLLKKVCNYEEKESPLPSFTNERVERGVIDTNSARLDVRARPFYWRDQNAFINVPVMNPSAQTQTQSKKVWKKTQKS